MNFNIKSILLSVILANSLASAPLFGMNEDEKNLFKIAIPACIAVGLYKGFKYFKTPTIEEIKETIINEDYNPTIGSLNNIIEGEKRVFNNNYKSRSQVATGLGFYLDKKCLNLVTMCF